MLQRQFTLEPDIDYSCYITAKQFWLADFEASWDDRDAFTLILLHSTSFHKETWEPTLHHLFEDIQKYRSHPVGPKIKCAWVIECPNHGESAILNDRALQRPPYYRNFGCEKYAEAAHRFMLRGPTFPTPVDFRREKLVGIGHSLGGVGISILPTLVPTIHFCALILVEPLLSPEGIDKLRGLRDNLISGAYERRDVWPSRQSASRYFRQRTFWDPDVLDRYVQHGLRTCEGVEHGLENHGVTLACSREEEATMYRDVTGPQRGIESLNKLSAMTPVGVIFGDKNDYIPRETQDALVDPASGRCIRVVSRIEGMGHLVCSGHTGTANRERIASRFINNVIEMAHDSPLGIRLFQVHGYRLLGKFTLVRGLSQVLTQKSSSPDRVSKRWIVDRATLQQARADDLRYVDDPEYFTYFSIFFANVITKLGKKLNFRQRVIATAIVFFRRFYIKNAYCETDPFIVIAACCYVAGKAEESPVHIKNVVAEARLFFSQQPYGVKSFPSDNSKLAEMEFYLVADLECDLTIFHPYRTLTALCAEAEDGPRYWGTGDGQLELSDDALQLAWSIINDTYRSDLCLLYPPHLLTITALYLTLVLHPPTRDFVLQKSPSNSANPNDANTSPLRRSSRQASISSTESKKPQDIIGFFAGLNVSMSLVATIAQEMISLYSAWERYREDGDASGASLQVPQTQTQTPSSTRGSLKRTLSESRSGSLSHSHSRTGTPAAGSEEQPGKTEGAGVVTPLILVQLLTRMRENRFSDLAHSSHGRPVAVDKRLERTQAAG
ncbi:cyclin-like protein [Butyriboletus roseoflavus]|nr:cyclin-like protein [Butyriboletus roseoflavus]